MHELSPQARPAVAPAIVVLAGIALLSGAAPSSACVMIVALSLFAALVLRTPALRRTFLLAFFAAAGATAGAWSWERAIERAADWLPADGSAVETEILGTVLRAPESDRHGNLWLRLAGRPWRDPNPSAAAATLRLVVRAGPSCAHVAALRRGDRVRVYARIRSPRVSEASSADGLARFAAGIDATGSIKTGRLVEKLSDGRMAPARALDLVLAAARARLTRSLGETDEARHAAAAMLLGDRGGMGSATLRALRDSGLFHLLAISGLNVALLVGAVFLVLHRLRLSRWSLLALVAPALWALAMLVGADPPVTRACAGTAIALAGRAVGRDGDPLNSLALVAAALALYDPPSIFHPGFQLTFSATAGLIAGARPFASSIPAPRPIAFVLGASAAAYVATAPVLAWHFGRLAPIGLLSNIAAGPLCGAVLGSALGVLTFGDMPVIGGWMAWALRQSVEALEGCARIAAEAPFATIRVAKPAAWLVLAVIVSLILAWSLSRRPRGGGSGGRWMRTGAASAVLALHLGPPPRPPAHVEVAILDVGQGQAIAIREPRGKCLLLDGGGSGDGRFDAGQRIVAPWLAAWGCRRIEAVIVSHAHDDHIGGLESIIRELDVGAVWLAAGASHDAAARDLAALAREQGAAIALAVAGGRFRIGALEVAILHPAKSDAALEINDRCAVARITTASGASLLVPGDLERIGESLMLGRAVSVVSQALVVGHHGAAGSSSEEFLAAIQPSVAVISVGEGNRFGHPAPATLERLRSRRAVTCRTDHGGTIVLIEEGGGWRVMDGPLRGPRETVAE